jgi:hypothetical protein
VSGPVWGGEAAYDELLQILAQLSTKKDATLYLPVRLTDGSIFYVASGGTGATLSQVKIVDSAGTALLIIDSNGRIGINNLPSDYFKAGQSIGNAGFKIVDSAGTAFLVVDSSGKIGVSSLPPVTVTSDVITDFQPHIQDANQYSATITTATTTTVIAAVAGKTIKVYDYFLWNNGTAAVTVTIKFGTSGKVLFKGTLQASATVNTGVICSKLRPWESNTNDSLQIVTSAACTLDYGIGAIQS